MSYWNAKYPNDYGEYEITFGSKNRETTKVLEKVCMAVMDGLVESPGDIVITEKLLKKMFPLGIPKTREDWNYSITARAVYEAIMNIN